MLKDNVLDTLYGNKTISNMPVSTAGETIKVIEEVLDIFRKENPYAALSDLFDE